LKQRSLAQVRPASAEGPGGGHYDNMTTTSRTKVACGFFQTPSGKWWAAQDFQ
jgi:hypothetical protein